MPAHTRASAAPGTPGKRSQTGPTISPEEAKIWHDRFSKAKGAIACPKCIESTVDKDYIPTCDTLSLTPSSNIPLMVKCNVCKKATRSVKFVKIAITAAEAELQSASLPTHSVTSAAMQYTSEQFQELSAKIADLPWSFLLFAESVKLYKRMQHLRHCLEKIVLRLCLKMLKMTEQIEDLRAENTAFRSQDPNPRTPSEETTMMFRDFMAQQAAMNSANKAARKELSKTISNFMTQLVENQNSRPAGDPTPVHPTLNLPAGGPATPPTPPSPTILPSQVPDTPPFPSYS